MAHHGQFSENPRSIQLLPTDIKSEKECYRYNSIYKLFINALTLDPPQPPLKRGEPGKLVGVGFLQIG